MSESGSKTLGRQKSITWLLILLPVLFLSGWGVITLMSAGAIRPDPLALVKKQAIWMTIGFCACMFSAFIDLNFLRKIAIPCAVLAFILMLLVFVPGVGETVKGSSRWVRVGSFVFQPSDLAKVSLVIWMAAYLQHFQRAIDTFWKGAFAPFILIGLFIAPILKEPDFGTSALCFAVAFGMMFMAGVRILHIAPFALLASLGISVLVYLNPNRLRRLASFLNRENEALDGGYQLTQAIYAFGAGKITGVGFGEGRQQYSFLPEAHTDFIFANIGEECGLVGTMLVLLSFLALFLMMIFNLKKAPNLFEFSLGLGAMLMIIVQALFNMGVVIGLLPTKGISLPFLSYGGSNLVVMFFFIGLTMNCMRRWNAPKLIRTTDYE